MSAKLLLIIPEIILVVGAVLVTVLGLSRTKALRDAVPGATVGLILLAFLSIFSVTNDERLAAAGLLMPGLVVYGKSLILLISAALVLLGVGLVDRRLERAIASGQVAFDPIRVQRGEHHAFLLLSIAGASDLHRGRIESEFAQGSGSGREVLLPRCAEFGSASLRHRAPLWRDRHG
jgi:hypothetical protein